MSVNAPLDALRPSGYRHEALFYSGVDDFVGRVAPFVRDGVRAGEPVLVVVSAEKIARLREALGARDAERVCFADMDEVGANPARIIPAWQAFLAEHAPPSGAVRGVGEPIGPCRGPAELAECHRHEALLNIAFTEADGFWLLCPYDVEALPEEVVREAARTHPFVVDGAGSRDSRAYLGPDVIAEPFADPLPRPGGAFDALSFDAEGIGEVRRFVGEAAARAGVPYERRRDLVLAASEVATNSVRHGGGAGVLRAWSEHDAFICEFRDRGGVADPLAGRVEPLPGRPAGRGLWLANQLCDLVQVRALADGGVVRLHVRR